MRGRKVELGLDREVIVFIKNKLDDLFRLGIRCVKVWYEPEFETIVIKPNNIPQGAEFHEWLFDLHSEMLDKFPEYDIVIHGMEEVDDVLYPEVHPPLLLRVRIDEASNDLSYQTYEVNFNETKELVKAA